MPVVSGSGCGSTSCRRSTSSTSSASSSSISSTSSSSSSSSRHEPEESRPMSTDCHFTEEGGSDMIARPSGTVVCDLLCRMQHTLSSDCSSFSVNSRDH